MSFDFAARDNAARLDFTDLVDEASRNARTTGRAGRKSSKNRVKQRATQASLLAPLLALEGCYTIGGNDGPLKGGGEHTPDRNDKGGSGGTENTHRRHRLIRGEQNRRQLGLISQFRKENSDKNGNKRLHETLQKGTGDKMTTPNGRSLRTRSESP